MNIFTSITVNVAGKTFYIAEEKVNGATEVEITNAETGEYIEGAEAKEAMAAILAAEGVETEDELHGSASFTYGYFFGFKDL